MTLTAAERAHGPGIRVVTNNMRALPPNPHPRATLEAAPHATVALVQEGNLPHFKRVMLQLGGHRVPAPGFVDKGQAYSCVVLYDPTVWEHVATGYPLAYEGHHAISLDRHLGSTELRHRALNVHVGFISYHSVTAGRDAQRRRMRREGDAAVRREVARYLQSGVPVVLGTDQNGTGNRLGPANVHAAHSLDHIYGWGTPHVALSKSGRRVIRTASDHDALALTVHLGLH